VRCAIDAASARPEFRVVHHSVQSNHLHVIVEAADRLALSKGMSALLVRIARGLNRLWRRRGSIFADRFHERGLRTPAEVRNSLVYVLQNARKHGISASGPDAYSSGPWFDGWQDCPGLSDALQRQRVQVETRFAEVWCVLTGVRGPGRSPAPGLKSVEPTTWLLKIGWKRKGLLSVTERPRSVSSPAVPRNQVRSGS
jgi:REP element-mobilizing transposase RayT